MADVWLGLFTPDAVDMTVKSGKPKKAFNTLSIVVARDHAATERGDLAFELGSELGYAMVNLDKPKMKDITDLLLSAGEGFYIIAWGDKKPHKKKGMERSYMPIKRTATGWAMCSRRPPYHVLLEFKSDEALTEALLRRMRNS